MEVMSVLRRLCEADGVSGEENAAAETALEMLKEYCTDAYIDGFNNVIGYRGKKDESKKTLLLEAHIDEIGMIVTFIDSEGFLKVSKCGGIDPRILPAQTVTIHGKENYKGIVTVLPPHAMPDTEKAVKIEDIAIDCGFTKEQAEQRIMPGDKVTVDAAFTKLAGNKVTGKALDNRAGVCTVLAALEKLKDEETAYNIAVLFACQEEAGGRGAEIAAYNINPDLAVAVDVSFAKTTDTKPPVTHEMGKGAMIGICPNISRNFSDRLINIAKEKNIPYQIEVMGRTTGTDADEIAVNRGGVVTGLVSVPLKNMHMPVEIVNTDDISAAAEIIAAFAKEGMN